MSNLQLVYPHLLGNRLCHHQQWAWFDVLPFYSALVCIQTWRRWHPSIYLWGLGSGGQKILHASVPVSWPLCPCVSHSNSLADECIHTSRYFGWVINFRYFNNFPDSSSNTLFANSIAIHGVLSMIDCTNSVMSICCWLLVNRTCLFTMSAMAWAYFDWVVGPEMGIVCNGCLSLLSLPTVRAPPLFEIETSWEIIACHQPSSPPLVLVWDLERYLSLSMLSSPLD